MLNFLEYTEMLGKRLQYSHNIRSQFEIAEINGKFLIQVVEYQKKYGSEHFCSKLINLITFPFFKEFNKSGR